MKPAIASMCLVMAAGSAAALGSTLVVDRGLPAINLNTDAGVLRSNVTWASESPTGFTGDDFTIGVSGESYVVDSIKVWGAQYNPLSDDIGNIWLYVGKSGSPLALISTGAITGNVNSNSSISHTFVTYPDVGHTDYYVGNSGTHFPICETTFSGLNMLVEGGTKYNFGVRGDGYLWWNHASNAALSGSPQDGADDKYLEFNTADLSSVIVHDALLDLTDNKSSDINVQVFATAVPEPASLGMLALGGLLLLARRRGA